MRTAPVALEFHRLRNREVAGVDLVRVRARRQRQLARLRVQDDYRGPARWRRAHVDEPSPVGSDPGAPEGGEELRLELVHRARVRVEQAEVREGVAVPQAADS